MNASEVHPGSVDPAAHRAAAEDRSSATEAESTSWLGTTDHRRIALLFLGTVSAVFLAGALAAALLRLELLTPAGDLLSADGFNRTFSFHGIAMIWFFLIPVVPTVLGTFLLPPMVGARNLAFPRLARTAWYLFTVGVLCLAWAALGGGIDTGWTFTVPLASEFAQGSVVAAAGGICLAALSLVLLSLTFLVTIHRERSPEIGWGKLPLFVWALYATSWTVVLSTPFLVTALVALILERTLGLGLFDPVLGGDPILFRQLFWFASRPALYVMVLPALGIASEVVAAASGRPVRGRRVVAACFGAIAVLGFFTWGVHLSTGGQSPLISGISSLMATVIAVPFALVLVHWLSTLRASRPRLDPPMAWALGFFALLIGGGLAGVGLVLMGVDVHLHGTLFVTGHVHLLALGVLMAFLAGLHLWWPEIAGRSVGHGASSSAALLAFVGAVLTFGPQIWLGVQGLPRRQWSYPEEFQVLQVLSTAGATLLGIGLLIPLVLFVSSLAQERSVPQ